MRTKMMIPVALVFVLAACLPGQAPVDVEPIVNTAVAQAMETSQSQIEQSVALTVAAQQAQATSTAIEEATPTTEASLDPTSTPFELPTLVPTDTPAPTAAANKAPYVPPQYACKTVSNQPKDNTEFLRGKVFYIKWTIVNTGSKTWSKGVDVKYYSGPKMTDILRVEIPKEIKPNEKYVVTLKAKAPDKRGFHVMTWTLDGQMCYPYVAIYAK
jgi:hypothetical protein